MALPEVVAGKYRVLREIARGGMGVVYAVEHQGTGEELALKVMSDRLLDSPQAIERFKREARAPTRIKSDHVVRMIDADTAPELGGAPFLVMELLEGDDLEKLSQREPPSAQTVVDWLRQTSRALDRAHALGFVHRDLKPANLFVARRPDGPPIVKVLDFGIVKMLADSGATESGATVGTPRYMAPEQVLAERGKVGPAADVWAMGMVAFRLLSGHDYWVAETTVSLIGQILHGKMATPSERGCDLGEAFDAWFARSCDWDSDGRYPTVGEQIDALGAALEGRVAKPARASDHPDAIGHASTTPLQLAPTPSRPTAVAFATPGEPSETLLATSTAGAREAPRSRAGFFAVAVGLAAAAVLAWWGMHDDGTPAPSSRLAEPRSEAAARSAPTAPAVPQEAAVTASDAGAASAPSPTDSAPAAPASAPAAPAPLAAPQRSSGRRPSPPPSAASPLPPISPHARDPLADPL